MTKTVRRFGIMGLIIGLLIAGAVSATAQGLQPQRTLGSRLTRPAQTSSQTADAEKDREARKARAAQRSQFSAGSLTSEFERERDTLFVDIVREAEICQTNLAEYATYPYWPDAMGVVSNFCEKENCVVVDVGHHFGSWKQGSWWQGSGKKAYVARCNLETESQFAPQRWQKDGFRVISRGGSYTNVVYGGVGSICCYDSDGRFVEMHDSLDKVPGMQQCFDDELKVNYGEQDRWMKVHGFAEEGSGREAENHLNEARTNAIARLEALRTILSRFPQWKAGCKWYQVCNVRSELRGPSASGSYRPLLGGSRSSAHTNDVVFAKMNKRLENLGHSQDQLIEEIVRVLTGLEFGSSTDTNGVLDLKFNVGSYENCTFGRISGTGAVNRVTLIAEFDPSCEQKTIHEKLDQGLSTLLSAIGMDRDALIYNESTNGARPQLGVRRRPGGNEDWKSVQSFSQRFTISRSKQRSGEYVVTISDRNKADVPAANDNARRTELPGSSLRARRLQRQQQAQAAAAKQQEEQAARDAERQAQAELERAQREAERAEQRQKLLAIQEELKRVREAKAAAAKSECATSCINDKLTSEKGIVAEKLGQCDFLLNKDFKKSAKVYLCLFSASWCPPCRREMPRIAKTYAETLKDDPDIELIHFSRDQNDEKAMAWAKEHDVKFPVVKPEGGNPLDLHCNGIPHLFIVKADGTLLEEGHPMRIFNEEKFREIKGSSIGGDAKSACGNNEAAAVAGDIPYGIRMEPAPGCEKGAEYVLRRLRDVYLPAALRYYGDPFNGKKATRVFTVVVKRNDGSDGRNYTGPSWGSCSDGVDRFTIGLSKGSDKWEMDITLLASKILTLCREDDGAALHIYANKFVDGAVGGVDPIPALKEDIRQGIEKAGDGSEKNGRIGVLCELAPMWSVFEELRKKHPTFLLDYHNLKNSRFACGKLPEQVSLPQMVGLLAEVTGENVLELCKKYGVKGAGKNSVAEKLGTGDFFLNKDFKKEAKYYFYLLSDYWRPEMPRIAKTYAEMLKDDPDIELIHVLYGRDYEKALAWAKGHDVKFPIVKDNPLRLYWRTSGDYMFIVNADGSVLKEGQPKILFTEEKLRRLKNGEPLSNMATINGVKWTYEIADGEVVLGEGTTRNGLAVPKDTVGSILIPDSIEGKPVRCIDEYAFSGCKGLTSITIPSSVTKIKGCAFEGCNGLTSLTIPSGVKEVAPSAFSDCGNLRFISVSADNGQYASSGGVLFDRSLQRLVRCPSGFRGVYVVPDGVTLIGRSAFSAWSSGFSRLSGVKIPDSVKSIGDYSFDFCKSLKEVILVNGVTTIGSCAFRCCDGLTSIKIPESVVNIDHYAFGACRSLASVTMCGERPKADTGVFKDCKKLTAIHVPANAKSWAGMKEWQGIPLVFDAETEK